MNLRGFAPVVAVQRWLRDRKRPRTIEPMSKEDMRHWQLSNPLKRKGSPHAERPDTH